MRAGDAVPAPEALAREAAAAAARAKAEDEDRARDAQAREDQLNAVKRLAAGTALAAVGLLKLALLPVDAPAFDVALWIAVVAFGGGLATLGEIMKAAGREA